MSVPVVRFLLAAVLVVLLLGLQPVGLPFPTIGAPADDGSGPLSTVADGVYFGERLVEGWRPSQVRQLVQRLAAEVKRPPVDAGVDGPTGGAIPELNGFVVDVEASTRAILEASPGERITPVFREIRPAVTLRDLQPRPIYRGNPEKRAVAFLINVAWGNEYIPQILEILEKAGVKGSFFLVGNWAERFPDLARQIAEAGHEIDSHGYGTPDYARLSEQGMAEQIQKADEVIEKVTGVKPIYFSSHQGKFNQSLLHLSRRAGHDFIMWTHGLDTADWMNPGSAAIVRKISTRLQPGGLILMHPTDDTVGALPAMIQQIERRGYRIVPLADLLSPSPFK